jgi:hypothetical protein
MMRGVRVLVCDVVVGGVRSSIVLSERVTRGDSIPKQQWKVAGVCGDFRKNHEGLRVV